VGTPAETVYIIIGLKSEKEKINVLDIKGNRDNVVTLLHAASYSFIRMK